MGSYQPVSLPDSRAAPHIFQVEIPQLDFSQNDVSRLLVSFLPLMGGK